MSVDKAEILKCLRRAETLLTHYVAKLGEFGVYGDGEPVETPDPDEESQFLTDMIARLEGEENAKEKTQV